MITSTLAFGKANACGNLKLAQSQAFKLYSTAPAASPVNGNGTAHSKPADAATQRELFMNVLNANATKRDAKQYLARFKPPKNGLSRVLKPSPLQEERNARHRRDQERLDRIGVNLGGLYAPARAIAESPQFARQEVEEKPGAEHEQVMHVALVCLRNPEMLDDATLDGVALTLSQLVKLDMRILVLFDCDRDSRLVGASIGGDTSVKLTKDVLAEQGERLNKALVQHGPEGARVVGGAIEVSNLDGSDGPDTGRADSLKPVVSLPKLLLNPLKRSIIPLVPTLAHTPSGQMVRATAESIMPALTQMLSGLPSPTDFESRSNVGVRTSLDRIILLDPFGGIPSKARGGGSHVFINLEQEFDDIENELAENVHEVTSQENVSDAATTSEQHRSNLRMLQKCLSILPSASSALIVTPQEAASSSRSMTSDDSTIGTGTRRQKNTLIHNLLTNKPTVSSSLPVARLPSTPTEAGEPTAVDAPAATLVKRGMPLTIIPSPISGQGWQLPPTGQTPFSLSTDPRIDLPRLVHLIEDSFRRRLDVPAYLHRIQNRTAGLIIAGSYEGAALLTWEQPPSTISPARLVPYLDKFAVLSSSQGESGVADILFQAMVRTCFPSGVCWRSRQDNPVNKWYFERAEGHWRIPGTKWTMFWTGEGVVGDARRWEDYVGVCRSVGPTWVDEGRGKD